MTVGKLFAINRLRKKKIFCINSRVINVTGSINCVCFDKVINLLEHGGSSKVIVVVFQTGTLTEDGLDMWGIIPVKENVFEDPLTDVRNLPEESPLLLGMATCHSLTLIDGSLFGDPLDVKVNFVLVNRSLWLIRGFLQMFESTGWILEEPGVKDTSKFDLLAPTIVKRNLSSNDQVRHFCFSKIALKVLRSS